MGYLPSNFEDLWQTPPFRFEQIQPVPVVHLSQSKGVGSTIPISCSRL